MHFRGKLLSVLNSQGASLTAGLNAKNKGHKGDKNGVISS